ncbi:carboxymethyltransferase [Scheffersomyces coipomensis]|uniref:carboxymethyltransferase n=1 Tax=Scheffersomyces coipomensis TaxID=1788519 RepID=UPI00315DA638
MIPTKPLTAEQIARQQRKIEKDRRRKQYEDLQVQGTNNSSIVSKRSVEKIYDTKLHPEEKEWFASFVFKKVVRRSPAINRGYWIRMESIKSLVKQIVKLNPGKVVNVINLGCGFDPLPFQLFNYDEKLKFIDIDYPELVDNKYKMIIDSEDIMKLIGRDNNTINQTDDSDGIKLGLKINHDRYKLIGCDLKQSELYGKQLSHLLTNKDEINVFIAEVSLAYMKNQYSNKIIEISSNLPNSHFLILEQILPDSELNSFAQKMIAHFDKLRSSLYCIKNYPTKTDQIIRFKSYFPHVEINNLFENWQQLIETDVKVAINNIEQFDEWEEFIIFCQHYVILHGCNIEGQSLYKDSHASKTPTYETSSSISFSLDENLCHDERLELKFPGICELGDKILIQGGLKQSRTNETLIVNPKESTIEIVENNGDEVPARMCHTITSINNEETILIGGRTRPGVNLKDIYKFRNEKWIKLTEMKEGRSRHCTVKIDSDHILIFGGLEYDSSEDLFMIYQISTNEFYPLKITGDQITNLLGSDVDYNGQYGIILGGMINVDEPCVNDKLYKFTIDLNHKSIHLTIIGEDSYLFSRIGGHVKLINDRKMIIMGGISPKDIYTYQNNAISLEIKEEGYKIEYIPIADKIRQVKSPLLIGFGVIHDKSSRQLTIISGGAVCYSFGSGYNGVYTIRY